MNIPLGNKVYVGLGLYFQRYAWDRTMSYWDSLHYAYAYDITGIAVPDEEYDASGHGYLASDLLYNETTTSVTIPVGIEYRFTRNNRWSVRFGAIFQYHRFDFNESESILVSEPTQEKVRWDNGEEWVDLDDNEYETTSGQNKEGNSNTVYVYGLGYQPTDYLQIDLLGYFGSGDNISILDTEFYQHMRLSFTIRF